MIRKILAVIASSGVLLGFLAVPAYAQDSSSSTGQTVAACNQTAKDSLKSIRDQFKAGTITKDARNTQVKAVETTRKDCVKAVLNAKRAVNKAKMEAAKAAAKAKKDAAKAAAEAQRATRRSTKVTPTPTP